MAVDEGRIVPDVFPGRALVGPKAAFVFYPPPGVY